MPKLTGPLFSLQAQGTIGNQLSYSARRSSPQVGVVPLHPDALSVPQLKHRFLYQLGIAQWNGMAAAERATYVARAVAHPFTPMNSWLSEWLSTFPNLLLAQTFLEGQDTYIQDSGPLADHSLLYGPSWDTAGPRPFIRADGVDDYVLMSDAAAMSLQSAAWTVLFRCRFREFVNNNCILGKVNQVADGWSIRQAATTQLLYQSHNAGSNDYKYTVADVVALDTWDTWAFTATPPAIAIYKGSVNITGTGPGPALPGTTGIAFRCFQWNYLPALFLQADLAWIVAFNRALSQAEIESIAAHPKLSRPT